MTDIREAREVIAAALRDRWESEHLDNVSLPEYDAEAVIAALSAAGMTICGEQVVFDKSIGGYTDTDGKPITVTRGVFVPLSDPQEGDK